MIAVLLLFLTTFFAVIYQVKGTAVTCENTSVPVGSCPDDEIHVWDTADYVVPAQESNAFFIVTNSVVTRNQTQRAGGWDEDTEASTIGSQRVWNCTQAADCPRFEASRNGALTGECNTTINVRMRMLNF